jgi:hypothetical protein
MKHFFALVGAVSLSACATAVPLPKAGPPVALAVASDANPDVIWIVREVDVAKPNTSNSVGGPSNAILYGLFACYRQPAAKSGPPQCFLANYSYKAEDLAWPGGLYMGADGVLRPISAPK